MKPYVIMSPDYNPVSGGVKVMWALFGWLLSKGVEVYMNRRPEGEVIAIYPEILHGNPVNSDTVVRYILNKPGVMAANGVPGPTSFPSSDILFYFSQLFSDSTIPDNRLLFLPTINLNTFYVKKNVKRENKCKFIGKGTDTHLPETEGLFTLDRSFARDQSALNDYLNTCSVMYCYDPCSAMTEVARLSGCRVVMLNNTQYTKEEFTQYEPGMNGLSWGIEEETPLDADAFRHAYIELYKMADYGIETLIKETQ